MHSTVMIALTAASLLLVDCNKQLRATTANGSNAAADGAAHIDGTWRADLATLEIGSQPNQLPWKDGKPRNFAHINEEALTVTYRLEGETLHMTSPSGQSYDARLDNGDTPIKGDIGGITAAVKKLADNSFEEMDKHYGKIISVTTFTAGADGKLHVTIEDKRSGSTMKYDADKE